MEQVLAISPERFQRHRFHTQERDWAETNCYVDVWIELLHALQLNPVAAMGFSVTPDFEGDQWTFFKYQLNDLYDLYGLEVQELVIWRPLIDHLLEQLALKRPVLVELDSKFLPDTAGTAYHQAHVKTTVAINEIDRERRHLGYFHAQGYYHLSGDDFDEVFAMPGASSSMILPPYAETVKLSQMIVRSDDELRPLSHSMLLRQLRQLPQSNPFYRFKERFAADFEWLIQQPIDTFHQYAFVTFRQFGACFELASHFLNWLAPNNGNLQKAAVAFKAISEQTKIYQFQLARAVTRKKSLRLETIDELAAHWATAIDYLKLEFRDLSAL
jgi:hypothetical protein